MFSFIHSYNMAKMAERSGDTRAAGSMKKACQMIEIHMQNSST